MSIVGVDAIPYRHYRRKLKCEQLIELSGVPHTILRATLVHPAWTLAGPRLP